MKKKRYWRLALVALIWFLLHMVLSEGSAPSMVQFLWLTVLFFAIKGNALGLLKVSKLAIIIQLFLGLGVWLWVAIDPVAQTIFGDALTFGLSIGIPTAAWIWLYLWARQKVAAEDHLPNPSGDISHVQGRPEGNSGHQNTNSRAQLKAALEGDKNAPNSRMPKSAKEEEVTLPILTNGLNSGRAVKSYQETTKNTLSATRSYNVDDRTVIQKNHATSDYQIIREPSVGELELEVKSYMLQGYRLVGGPFPLIEDSQHWVCQAIQRH